MGASVLVTGATGFIGSRLTRELIEAGERVKIFCRPGSSLRALSGIDPNSFEIAYGDITVGHTVFRALAGCDRLFHLATEFSMWDRNPSKILDAAVTGTRETLEAARQRGIEKVVVTSSTGAVGATREPIEMDEAFPFNRADSETYIVAKWRAEQIAREMADEGTPIVIVNPATVIGPGDFKPTPSGDLVLSYLNWNLPLRFPSSQGGINIADVDDVARGHFLAMQRGRVGERYILGGDNLTFTQVFATMAELTGLRGPGHEAKSWQAMLLGRVLEAWARASGTKPQLTYKLARDYVGHYVWVSSKKAEVELGYTHRGVRQTLARAIRFYLEHGYVSHSRASAIRFDLRAAA